MQIKIAFVLLLSLLTISFAANVTVYKRDDKGDWISLLVPPQLPWKFSCNPGDYYQMRVTVKNISPSVTRQEVYSTGNETKKADKDNYKLSESYKLEGHIETTETQIYLYLFKSQEVCSSLHLVQVRSDLQADKDRLYANICGPLFRLEVDLRNECDDPALVTSDTRTKPAVEPPNNNNNTAIDLDNAHETSPNVVLTYVIPVIAVCVMIVIVMYIYVKKYRHRNSIRSDQVDEIELNTYATPNDVLYADLSLAHGNSQRPRCEENSTYAQIIGVMRPVDENVKRK